MTAAPTATPADRLNAIVEQGLCIGCGLCESVAGRASVSMSTTPDGYLHPVVVGPLDHPTVDTIVDVCPGTRIDGLPDALVEPDTTIDPVWGPWRRIVRAWAADPVVRHEGSTGGVLTALGRYLIESGRVDFVLHVRASEVEPTFGERTLSFSGAEVLAAAGSRYGPTAPLLDVGDVLTLGRPFAFVAKPCDIAALRNWARYDERVDDLVRYWLTPVCGGFATPDFTTRFLTGLGVDTDELIGLRYRGRGCPGPTVAETSDRRVEAHYLDYWGDDSSQWTLPWRCKICPDGIGESADLAASDTWPGGSPDRIESETDPGVNAIIARTAVGEELLAAAERDGALTIERDIAPSDMTEYQPHQMRKKRTVAARHAGIADEGRIVPTTHRLRIAELAAELPAEVYDEQRSGARVRIRDGRASHPTPERCS